MGYITGNRTDSPDFLKVLLTLKENIMKDLKVCEICKVVDIINDYYTVVPINNDSQKIICNKVKGLEIELNDLVIVTFTDQDSRLNLNKYELNEKFQNSSNKTLHSINNGIIISSYNRSQPGPKGDPGLQYLAVKRTFTGDYPVGTIVTISSSDFNRTPVTGDIFVTLCAGRYYTLFQFQNATQAKVLNRVDLIPEELGSNPNLLINGDFRVNQRGNEEYTNISSWGRYLYSVDRWALYGATGAKFNANTKTITSQTWFLQRVENDLLKVGETYTLSIKLTGQTGTAPSIHLFIRGATGGTRTVIKDTSLGNVTTGVYSTTFTLNSKYDYYDIGMYQTATAITQIDYIKLEVGSMATAFSTRPYAEELAICQRYYQKVRLHSGANCPNSATTIYPLFSLPVSLRTRPTINIITMPTLRGQGKSKDVTDITVNNLYNNGVLLLYTSSELSVNYVYASHNGECTLDAEIY